MTTPNPDPSAELERITESARKVIRVFNQWRKHQRQEPLNRDSETILLDSIQRVIAIEARKSSLLESQRDEAQRKVAWRPIESAPKDGTYVDLWCIPDGRRTDARFINGHWHEWADSGFERMEWCKITLRATHWMPLPEGPTPRTDATL